MLRGCRGRVDGGGPMSGAVRPTSLAVVAAGGEWIATEVRGGCV